MRQSFAIAGCIGYTGNREGQKGSIKFISVNAGKYFKTGKYFKAGKYQSKQGNEMERMKKMVLIGISVLAAAGLFLMSCSQQQNGTDAPSQGSETPGSSAPGNGAPGNTAPGNNAPGNSTPGSRTPAGGGPGSEAYAVKSVLRELFSVDPDKGIGVYGRYTELAAEGDVPEALSRVLAEVNARAKESVETRAARWKERSSPSERSMLSIASDITRSKPPRSTRSS